MLQKLNIQNIAIIDNVSIDFQKGFNVLTGETGAGKSIIIDSLNAILGERISKDLIRTGADKAFIEAVFDIGNLVLDILQEFGIEIEEDGIIIISREFTQSGKNTCRINGRLVTLSTLKLIGERLVDVHGQHDNQSLLRTEKHIELLDSFGGNSIKIQKEEYIVMLEKFRIAKRKLQELSGNPYERERRIDILKFQLEEIDNANLQKNEDVELESQRILLVNSEKISSVLQSTYNSIFTGVKDNQSSYDIIKRAIKDFSSISHYNSDFSEILCKLEEISFGYEDVVESIRAQIETVEYSPETLEQICERIDLITKLKRKYGNNIEEILIFRNKVLQEINDLNSSEELVTKLNLELSTYNIKLFNICKLLHNERKIASEVLENKITQELSDLEIKNATFKVKIDFDSSSDERKIASEILENKITQELSNLEIKNYTKNGLCKVEFLISTNAGEPLKPLSKIASGGEMSRIMLAIKTILAKIDKLPTLIFDEIDTGISGKAAQKVGLKLSYLSNNHQVICITHLPQIAAMGDAHFLIEKNSNQGNTYTSVVAIQDDTLIAEIARIIGGEAITDITLKHAYQMLGHASEAKKNMSSSIES